MSFEIERKFLVHGDAWRPLATRASPIRQAYLTGDGRASVRVRIEDGSDATLSIKSRAAELRRLELQYPIPLPDAEALLTLRAGCLIRKVRHVVPWHDLIWEIDVFDDDNAGLIIGEIELHHEGQHVPLPGWVGAEVTGQPQYYNNSLAQRPFAGWRAEGDALVRQTMT